MPWGDESADAVKEGDGLLGRGDGEADETETTLLGSDYLGGGITTTEE